MNKTRFATTLVALAACAVVHAQDSRRGEAAQAPAADRAPAPMLNADYNAMRMQASMFDFTGRLPASANGTQGTVPPSVLRDADALVRQARARNVPIELALCPTYVGSGPGRTISGVNTNTACIIQGVNLGGRSGP